MSIAQITDHEDRAEQLIIERYRKERIVALLRSWVARVQDLEDTFWDLHTKRALGSAEGATLDLLGKIVGQPRDNRSDTVYRLWIAARILVNRSSGMPEQLIAIAKKLVGAEVAVRLEEQYPAALTIYADEVTDGPSGVEIAKLLQLAKAAGVGLQYHWFNVDETFALSDDGTPDLDSPLGLSRARLAAVSDGRDMAYEAPEPGVGGGSEILLVVL